MAITIDVSVKQIATILKNMSKGELETLLIEMDTDFCDELKGRIANLDKEIQENKTLSIEEVFDV